MQSADVSQRQTSRLFFFFAGRDYDLILYESSFPFPQQVQGCKIVCTQAYNGRLNKHKFYFYFIFNFHFFPLEQMSRIIIIFLIGSPPITLSHPAWANVDLYRWSSLALFSEEAEVYGEPAFGRRRIFEGRDCVRAPTVCFALSRWAMLSCFEQLVFDHQAQRELLRTFAFRWGEKEKNWLLAFLPPDYINPPPWHYIVPIIIQGANKA